jgi:hypothetical protein
MTAVPFFILALLVKVECTALAEVHLAEIVVPRIEALAPLPKKLADAIPAERRVALKLDGKGDLFRMPAGTRIEWLPRLREMLEAEKRDTDRLAEAAGLKNTTKLSIEISADGDVRYERVWQVLDTCKQAGFVHWQLRVITANP